MPSFRSAAEFVGRLPRPSERKVLRTFLLQHDEDGELRFETFTEERLALKALEARRESARFNGRHVKLTLHAVTRRDVTPTTAELRRKLSPKRQGTALQPVLVSELRMSLLRALSAGSTTVRACVARALASCRVRTPQLLEAAQQSVYNMRCIGLVERVPKTRNLWRITERGVAALKRSKATAASTH